MTPNNFRVKSGLTVGTTISGGNTTITGFINVSGAANVSSLAVGGTTLNSTTFAGTANNASFLGGTAASGYQTTAGLSANVATLTSNNSTNLGGSSLATIQGQITGNAATAYTNAITIAANGSNITSGTVAFARLPALYLGTTTIQSTSAAQAVSGITTLATGNTTITGFANVTSTIQGGSSLTIAGAASGITTLAAGNTTITGFANVTSTLQVGGISTFSGNVVLGSVGVSANGGFGTAGEVLHSNGTATYWAADDNSGGTVTSIATANGLSGGTITTTGTLGVTTGSTLTVNTTGIHVNTANLSVATSQLTGDVALGTQTSGNYVATISAANGISGTSSAEGGTPTIGVTTGSTLTVNTAGIHVNSALSIASLALSGDLTVSGNLTVSGTRTYVNTTTLDVGDNIFTLNADLGASAPSQDAGMEIMRGTSANVQFLWDETNDRWTTNGQPIAVSSLVAAGAASGITTLAAGNTTITGFANVTSTIQGGSSLAIAGALSGVTTAAMGNTTITGFANVTTTIQGGSSLTIAGAASGITTLAAGNTTITGFVNATSSVNAASHTVGTSFIANTTGTTVNVASWGATFRASNSTNFSGVRWDDTAGTIRAGMYRYDNSDLTISIYDNTGTFQAAPLVISASTGTVTLSRLATTNGTFSGAVSGITTLGAGNTTITGFANASVSVNSALLTVGTSFIANTTGAFHTGTVNAASFTTTGLTINATGIVPTSNSSGQTLGNTTSRFVLSANSIDTTGAINIAAGQVLKFNNDVGISRSTAAVLSIGNGTQNDSTGTISLTGGLFQGAVNAASHTVGSSFIANSTGITSTGFANVSTTLSVAGQGQIGTGVAAATPNTTSIATGAHTILSGSGGNVLAFGQYDSGTSYAQWIQSSFANPTTAVYNIIMNPLGGNVGVGNTVPAHKLSVGGTIASGNTSITGFANVSTTLQVGGISTLAANLVMANNFITRPVLAGYSEHEVSNTAVTGTFTLDFSTANFFDLILTGNTTISPSGVPANTRMVSATLVAKQDATGGRTITWPAGTKYAGGVSPPATTTANAIDIWSIMTYDAGNTYIVSLSVKGAA